MTTTYVKTGENACEETQIYASKLRAKPPKLSPWGQIDYIKVHAVGIFECSTPGHGGFHLDRSRQKELVKRLPDGFTHYVRTWFEEDCDWAIVVWAFSLLFTPEQVEQAERTLVRYHAELAKAWGIPS